MGISFRLIFTFLGKNIYFEIKEKETRRRIEIVCSENCFVSIFCESETCQFFSQDFKKLLANTRERHYCSKVVKLWTIKMLNKILTLPSMPQRATKPGQSWNLQLGRKMKRTRIVLWKKTFTKMTLNFFQKQVQAAKGCSWLFSFILSFTPIHTHFCTLTHTLTHAHSRTSQTFRLSPIFHCVSTEAIFLKLHFKSFFVRILLLSTMDEKKNHLSTKEKLSWLIFLFFCLQIGRTRMLAFSSRMDIHFIEYSPRDYVIRIGAPLLPKSWAFGRKAS